MSKEEEIKVIPPKAAPHGRVPKKINYMPWIIGLVILYYGLILLISLVPMAWYIRVLALILGTFLIFDFHHSIKHYVRYKEQ